MRDFLWSIFCAIALVAAAAAAEDSAGLSARLLADNAAWLQPAPDALDYHFAMQHADKSDRTDYQIRYANGKVSVNGGGRKTIDNEYDTNNSAYPPQLITILQGVTFFGPLQELALHPDQVKLAPAGKETLGGKTAQVLWLTPAGQPSKRSIDSWEKQTRETATGPRYRYELTAGMRENNGRKEAILQARCLFEEGPGWRELQDDLRQDPTRLTWREGRGSGYIHIAYRAVLIKTPDGEVPMIVHRTGEVHLIPGAILTEGEAVTNPQLLEAFKTVIPKPERGLPMRFGCGVWHLWYGYMGGGAREEKIWIDPDSGAVLREEGYGDGKRQFMIDYGEFDRTAEGKEFPRQVTIVYEGLEKQPPWRCELNFEMHGGKAWMMRNLKLYQGKKLAAEAWTEDVVVK